MLFKRFILLTVIVAGFGILMANLIQSSHPNRTIYANQGFNTSTTPVHPCEINARFCSKV